MTLNDCLRILRERWAVVLVAVLAALLAAGAFWYVRPAEYTARLTMYVSAQTADTAQSAYQGAQLSQQRVTSYVQLVDEPRVVEEVRRRLGLTTSPDDLAEQIAASSTPDSVLVDVAVTDRSPQRAADIANVVGQAVSALVTELERPTTPGAQPPVAIRVVQPAAAPALPSSIGLPVALALGLLAGCVLGIGLAMAASTLDASVKTPEHLHDATGAPNLGFVAFDARTPQRPLIVHDEARSPRSEAFRQLRTNLQFVDVDQPRKVVVVTSPLPAEGKSTTLANLAIAMQSSGHRVLVVEADLRRPKLADLLGLDRSVGLTTVLAGRIASEDAIQHWPGGLDVLASGPLPPNPSELLASQQMANLLAAFRGYYDAVLVDTPPLLPVTDAAAVAPAADGVVMVCRYKQTRRDQLRTAAQALRAVSAPVLGTVFTMVPARGPRAYAQYHSYYHAVPGGPAPTGAHAPRPTAPVRWADPSQPHTPDLQYRAVRRRSAG